MPSYSSQPISEFDRGQPLLSLAFPSLFPTGAAEFYSFRPRAVSYRDLVKYLLLYKDGRFERHPTFRYLVFNTVVRQQVNKNSSFYVKNLSPARNISFEDLQAAFADDTPEAEAIVNSITRFARKIKGTAPYWAGELRRLRPWCARRPVPRSFSPRRLRTTIGIPSLDICPRRSLTVGKPVTLLRVDGCLQPSS